MLNMVSHVINHQFLWMKEVEPWLNIVKEVKAYGKKFVSTPSKISKKLIIFIDFI